jgi:hypothetical protein
MAVRGRDELTEKVRILSGQEVLRVRCGCHSANLLLENLDRGKVIVLAFQDEKRLMPPILKGDPSRTICKKRCNFEIPITQDTK